MNGDGTTPKPSWNILSLLACLSGEILAQVEDGYSLLKE